MRYMGRLTERILEQIIREENFMKVMIFVILTVIKVAIIGYTGYPFFRYFRSDGKKALRYLGLFLLGIIGITLVEFLVAFYLPGDSE
jgi:hypothetical protein